MRQPERIIEVDCVTCADGRTGFFETHAACEKCGRRVPSLSKDPLAIPPTLGSIQGVLKERGDRYGAFDGHAHITQRLKAIMRNTKDWEKLTDSQKEALEMTAHKIGRILNGDPNYLDSWIDIVGYVQLVCNQLQGNK